MKPPGKSIKRIGYALAVASLFACERPDSGRASSAVPVSNPEPIAQEWTVVKPGWGGHLKGLENRRPKDGILGSQQNPIVTADLTAYFEKAPCPSGDPPQITRVGNIGDSAGHGDIVDIYLAACRKDGWLLTVAVDHYHSGAGSTAYPPGFKAAPARPASPT